MVFVVAFGFCIVVVAFAAFLCGSWCIFNAFTFDAFVVFLLRFYIFVSFSNCCCTCLVVVAEVLLRIWLGFVNDVVVAFDQVCVVIVACVRAIVPRVYAA